MFNNLFDPGAEAVGDEDFILGEINRFKDSRRRSSMLDGLRYFCGQHDILARQRTVIGENGEPEAVYNLPNNRVVDNQYAKMVIQKNNYLLGKPFSFRCGNAEVSDALGAVMGRGFRRTLKAVGEDSLNCGVGWLFVYYDDEGRLCFKRLNPLEVIPEWADEAHTELDCAIRVYETTEITKRFGRIEERTVEKVEVYSKNGILYYTLDGGRLKPDVPFFRNYFTVSDESGGRSEWNWERIPLIPFRSNSREIPLIERVKTLQDGLNSIESNFQNIMEEDVRNSILVLVNYDGEDLAGFRKNLAEYGVVPVRTVDGGAGDLKSLKIEVNSENYRVILELFKRGIVENAMGYDARDDRASGNPNELNLRSMYSDIDLDANSMETEFQAAFERLLWFVRAHFRNIGMVDISHEKVDVIFDRDIMMNEGEVIDNCLKSVGLISNETIVAMHPWISDPAEELKRIKNSGKDPENKVNTE